MGSSSIGAIVIGVSGPTGNKGPRGNTGATGTGSGKTGPQGSTGLFIEEVNSYRNFIDLISNTNKYFTIEGTKGSTGYTGIAYGQNIGTGLSLYSTVSGYTLTLRGISLTGNLTGEITNDVLTIVPLDVNYGVSLFSGITTGRVLYSRNERIVDSSKISFGKTYGEFSFSGLTTISGSLSTYTEFQGNLIQIPAGTTGLILGITRGSVYKIGTPVGISGFTLDLSLCNDNELISATLFFEGNDITQFPMNVYFENDPYSSLFGCGTNIMNLMTYDKGQNWFATIIDRGYGTTLCTGFEGLGSCCYLDKDDYDCIEYVSEKDCLLKNGTFNLMKPCDSTCGPVSTCCSNGNCVPGIEKEECEYFGGKYFSGLLCEKDDEDSDSNQLRLCYSESHPITSCCVNGECLEKVTFRQCVDYYKGIPFVGICSDLNCKANPPREIFGACCNYATNVCSNTTQAGCSAQNGVFFGDESACETVNCCFDFPSATGSCCLETGECVDNVEEIACKGVFRKGVSCVTKCEPPPVDISRGLCCTSNSCESDITREECVALDSNAKFFPNVIFNDWTNNPFRWDKNVGDCEFCNAQRYAIMVSGSDDGAKGKALSFDFRCFSNKYDAKSDDEASIGWSPRVSIESSDNGNTTKISLNDEAVYLEPNCGSVDYIDYDSKNGSKTNEEQKLCIKDSFIAGQIFARKRVASTTEIFENPEITSQSTQEEFRAFIYDKYMQDILWVLGDYERKVCTSLCGSLTSSETYVQLENSCCCDTCYCESKEGLCETRRLNLDLPSLCYIFRNYGEDLVATGCIRCEDGCCYSGAKPDEKTTNLGASTFIPSKYCGRISFQDMQMGDGFDKEPQVAYTLYNNLLTSETIYSCEPKLPQSTKLDVKINQIQSKVDCGGNPDPCKEFI